MEFVYEQALEAYMKKKGKKVIAVEVVTSNNSDFEVTELHVRFLNEKMARAFKEKKHFRSHETELGEVLLPPYRLEYEDKVIFGLKSFLGIKYITHQGMKL